MKTKIKYLAFILVAFTLGACSSSMQMSQSSGYQGDDLYFNPSEKYSVKETAEKSSNEGIGTSSLKLAELEKKYTEILANDTSENIDTTIYKSPQESSYESVLSDSYQESYERRLRGRANPYYRISSLSPRYYQDYWYASAYDPAFYNIIVMGTDIWVEPYYISSMFGWPRYNYGYNYYWGSSWYSGLYYNGFYGFNYGYPYSSWGYNNYYWGYNDGFANGYFTGNQGNSANYHYGRRPAQGTVNYGNRPGSESASATNINERKRDLSDKQATFKNDATNDRNSRLRGDARPVSQDPTKENVTRPIRDKDVREPNRDPNSISRPSRESLNVNPTRINSGDTRTSKDHNPSYTRPNAGRINEFNRPSGNYPATEANRSSNRNNQNIATPSRTPTRQPARSYNPPPRISSPATSSPSRGRSTGGSGNVSRPSSGSSSGTSVAPTRSSGSSSGGSSKSSSGSSSSSSSSSSGDRSRSR